MYDISLLIKYFGVALSAFYVSIKIMNKASRRDFVIALFAATLAVVAYFLQTKYKFLLVPGLLMSLAGYAAIKNKGNFLYAMETAFISLAGTLIILLLSVAISLPFLAIVYTFYETDAAVHDLFAWCFTTFFELIISFVIFRFRKFRCGIPRLIKKEAYETLIVLSIIIDFAVALYYLNFQDYGRYTAPLILLTFCGIVFFVWWRKHVNSQAEMQKFTKTTTTRDNVLQECERQNTLIVDDNKRVSAVLHRDNKFLTPIKMELAEISKSYPSDTRIKELIATMDSLLNERNELIGELHGGNSNLAKTHLFIVDSIMNYVLAKAALRNVNFAVSVEEGAVDKLKEAVLDNMSLNTLLSDLGDNAIIAASFVPEGCVEIAYKLIGGSAAICVFDNAEQFDAKVIENMGRMRITTHKEDGGSGIGLQTVLEVVHNQKATLLFDETVENEKFTKCVCVIFDGKDRIAMRTNRPEITEICLRRKDVVLVDKLYD